MPRIFVAHWPASSELPERRGIDGVRFGIELVGYLFFPTEETVYDFAQTHPAIQAWLGRVAALPGWKPPYELLPGKRLRRLA